MHKKMKKVSVILGVVILTTSVLYGCGNKTQNTNNPASSTASQTTAASKAKAVEDTKDNYVAKVGNEAVTQSEFYFFLQQTKNSMESAAQQSGTTDLTKFWTTKIGDKDPKEMAKEETLTNLQEYKIQLSEAKSRNVTLTEQEKADAKKSFDAFVKNNGGEQAVAERLKSEVHISLEQYKDISSNFSIIQKYMTEKQKEMSVTDAEAAKYYTDNKVKFDTVTVDHILFLTVDMNTNQPLAQDKQDQAKKKADDALARVNKGEDIKVLAKTLSEDTGVTQNGGEYTIKKDGQMVKEFEDWAFSKNVGDTGIIKTSYGYHVMKKAKVSTAEEALKSAKTELQNNKLVAELNKLKTDSKYKIEKNDKVYSKLEI